MMKPEIKKLWIDALRSGEYKQGKKQLKNDENEFCCLGVLCDVIKDDIGGYWDENCFVNKFTGNCSSIFLIPDVVKFCDLECKNPNLKFKSIDNVKIENSLSVLNDKYGLTFNQIADLIEEQL